MSSGTTNVWKRIFDLWASIVKMVQNGTRSPEWLAAKLQAMVDEPEKKWKLHLHPTQERDKKILGWDLERYYGGPTFKDRHYSLESPEVKGWIANPETYPKELKNKCVFLWGSRLESGNVAYLIWGFGPVRVRWYDLRSEYDQDSPALLASE